MVSNIVVIVAVFKWGTGASQSLDEKQRMSTCKWVAWNSLWLDSNNTWHDPLRKQKATWKFHTSRSLSVASIKSALKSVWERLTSLMEVCEECCCSRGFIWIIDPSTHPQSTVGRNWATLRLSKNSLIWERRMILENKRPRPRPQCLQDWLKTPENWKILKYV